MFRRTGLTNIEPIELDIHFSEGFSATDIVHLVVELLKTLLLQRHQIPFPIDRLKSDVVKHTRAQEGENKKPHEDSNSMIDHYDKELHKKNRNRIKSNRLKEKYIKRCMIFLEVYDQLENNIKAEILSRQIDEISSILFIFGTSLVSPKEIYKLQLPTGNLKISNEAVNRRIMMQLFRTMATNDKIFSRMGEKLSCTNLFVALEKQSSRTKKEGLSRYLSVKNEFNFPPINRRCKLATFILSHDISSFLDETPAKARKLSDSRNVFNTPQPMEMCTPFARNTYIKQPNDAKLHPLFYPQHEMEVTPCVKTHKQRKQHTNQLLNSSSKTIFSARKSSKVQDTSEIEYSVLETEELFRNTSLNRPQETLTLDNLYKNQNISNYWIFFENIIKGFRDPQLMQ